MIDTERDAAQGPVRLVEAGTCGTRIEAELRRSALLAAGEQIVVVSVDDAGGLHPEMVNISNHAVRLMVPEDRVDVVQELLGELDAGDHELGGTTTRPTPDETSAAPLWLLGAGLALAVLWSLATAMGLIG